LTPNRDPRSSARPPLASIAPCDGWSGLPLSEHRRPEIRFSDAPRGTCRWCGEAILYEAGAKRGQLDRRRRWHPRCLGEYEATDPREARERIRRRDRGICAACGLDTKALKRKLRGRGAAARLRERGFVPRRSLWELDHVVPLIDGGGHDPSNLQTLCRPCHQRKSAGEARSRAVLRRDERSARAEVAAPSDDSLANELDTLLERADAANARLLESLHSL
jgi:5-methylcytosine-specific restriction protein A